MSLAVLLVACIDLAAATLGNRDHALTPAEVLAVARCVGLLSDAHGPAHRAAAVNRRATYGQLTAGANRSLAHARGMATQTNLPDAAAIADAAAAHADLVAALGHLGHTLHTPAPARRPSMADGSPRPTPRPRALLAQLEAAGLARDWEAPRTDLRVWRGASPRRTAHPRRR